MQASTVALYTTGAIFAGATAYLVYFDYRRHNDPQFRKQLNRRARRIALEEKQAMDVYRGRQRELAQSLAGEVQPEEFPTDGKEMQQFFMEQLNRGEQLQLKGPDHYVEAALCFYKAIKSFPDPRELMNILSTSVAPDCLDILAEMIAIDPSIGIGLKRAPEVTTTDPAGKIFALSDAPPVD